MVHLSEAHDYARQTCCDLWEFAIEIDTLAALGLSRDDLRGWSPADRRVRTGDHQARRHGTQFPSGGELPFHREDVLHRHGCRAAPDGHDAGATRGAAGGVRKAWAFEKRACAMGVPKLLERSGIDPRLTDSNLGLQRALLELTLCRRLRRSEQGDPWEFAVEMDCLLAAGLSTSDLRWLVKKGFVEHAYEITRRGDTARRFKSGCNVSFEGRTCFLLTKSGLVLAAAHGLRLPAVNGARERDSPLALTRAALTRAARHRAALTRAACAQGRTRDWYCRVPHAQPPHARSIAAGRPLVGPGPHACSVGTARS